MTWTEQDEQERGMCKWHIWELKRNDPNDKGQIIDAIDKDKDFQDWLGDFAFEHEEDLHLVEPLYDYTFELRDDAKMTGVVVDPWNPDNDRLFLLRRKDYEQTNEGNEGGVSTVSS